MVACGNQFRPCAPRPCRKDPESEFHLAGKERALRAGALHPNGSTFGGGSAEAREEEDRQRRSFTCTKDLKSLVQWEEFETKIKRLAWL